MIRIHTFIKLIGIGLLSLTFACQDVIEVDTPSDDTRLIIDAFFRLDLDEPTTKLVVRVSQTNGFFETTPPADLMQITLSNLDNPVPEEVVFLEEGPGVYAKTLQTAILTQDRWLLQIDFEDQYYIAETTFAPAPPIDNLVQGDEILFNEDDVEVKVTYTDIPDQENYYVFDFGFGEYLATEDTFYQGQQFEFSYFYDGEDVLPGDDITVSILGADADLYNYMNQLIEQSEDEANPFQTPTLTVRGNFINVSNIDNDIVVNNLENEGNFALGYFALVQTSSKTITITE